MIRILKQNLDAVPKEIRTEVLNAIISLNTMDLRSATQQLKSLLSHTGLHIYKGGTHISIARTELDNQNQNRLFLLIDITDKSLCLSSDDSEHLQKLRTEVGLTLAGLPISIYNELPPSESAKLITKDDLVCSLNYIESAHLIDFSGLTFDGFTPQNIEKRIWLMKFKERLTIGHTPPSPNVYK